MITAATTTPASARDRATRSAIPATALSSMNAAASAAGAGGLDRLGPTASDRLVHSASEGSAGGGLRGLPRRSRRRPRRFRASLSAVERDTDFAFESLRSHRAVREISDEER